MTACLVLQDMLVKAMATLQLQQPTIKNAQQGSGATLRMRTLELLHDTHVQQELSPLQLVHHHTLQLKMLAARVSLGITVREVTL